MAVKKVKFWKLSLKVIFYFVEKLKLKVRLSYTIKTGTFSKLWVVVHFSQDTHTMYFFLLQVLSYVVAVLVVVNAENAAEENTLDQVSLFLKGKLVDDY